MGSLWLLAFSRGGAGGGMLLISITSQALIRLLLASALARPGVGATLVLIPALWRKSCTQAVQL